MQSKENDSSFQRQHWINDNVAQLMILLDMISWTEEVSKAFDDREDGNDLAMINCRNGIIAKLKCMIDKVIAGPQGDMDEKKWKALKTKTIAIITIQVHERDVVMDLVKNDVKDVGNFRWQSQLRFEIDTAEDDDTQKTANARVCDWIQEYK